MENVKAKAAELKKLLAETYGIRNDADLERELAKQSLDISLFVLPPVILYGLFLTYTLLPAPHPSTPLPLFTAE